MVHSCIISTSPADTVHQRVSDSTFWQVSRISRICDSCKKTPVDSVACASVIHWSTNLCDVPSVFHWHTVQWNHRQWKRAIIHSAFPRRFIPEPLQLCDTAPWKCGRPHARSPIDRSNQCPGCCGRLSTPLRLPDAQMYTHSLTAANGNPPQFSSRWQKRTSIPKPVVIIGTRRERVIASRAF